MDDVKKDPYTMPAGFVWCSLDVMDSKEVAELYTLLNENYVEDDDNMFRSALHTLSVLFSTLFCLLDLITLFHFFSGH